MSEPISNTVDIVRRGGRWFFGVPIRKQTYRNLLYLFLSFPLGIGYFTVLVTSVTTSLVLILLLIGIPMLAMTLFVITELTAFERFLADRLLGTGIPTSKPPEDLREGLKRLVFDRSPWVGTVYLFSKFVIGIAVFVLLTFGATLTYTLLAAPLHYREESVGIHVADPIEFIPVLSYQHNGWTLDLVSPITIAIADGELLSLYVDSFWAALLVSLFGVFVGLLTLHLFNAVAWLYAAYTRLLLRRTQRSSIGRFFIRDGDSLTGALRGGRSTRDGPNGRSASQRADDPTRPAPGDRSPDSEQSNSTTDPKQPNSTTDERADST